MNSAYTSLKVIFRKLFHFECRRTSKSHNRPEDVRVGAYPVVDPFGSAALAGRAPLGAKTRELGAYVSL